VQAREVATWTVSAALGLVGVLAAILIVVVLLVRLGAVPAQGPVAYLAAWLRGGPIPGLEDVADAPALVSRSLLSRLLNPWTALGLVALLVTIALSIQHPASSIEHPASSSEHPASSTPFVLLLFATGALLTLGVEYVYLRDNFGTRMNTVFKFYFQAWVMWGVAAACALAGFVRKLRPRGSGHRGGVGVVAVAALLVAAGLVYLVLAIPARADEYGGPATLDGAAYLAETEPGDTAAVAWLNENVSGAPVILEAPGDGYRAYVYEGRVSAHTGLPTLLGWAGHEHQWRGSYDEQARREPDIETLYTSVDIGEVSTLLDKYDVSYVYVGPLERARYPAAGLAKFAALMDVVYDAGGVTIYGMGE
jgi:YYY domain-containing protein